MELRAVHISSVKKQTNGGYLLNGSMSVPEAPGNRQYEAIQAWIAEGNTPVAKLEPTNQELLARLDIEKRSRLKGGFLVNGVRFDSDINAEIRYMQLATKFSSDPMYETRWKAADNVWVTMDAALFLQVIGGLELLITDTYAWREAEQEKLKE